MQQLPPLVVGQVEVVALVLVTPEVRAVAAAVEVQEQGLGLLALVKRGILQLLRRLQTVMQRKEMPVEMGQQRIHILAVGAVEPVHLEQLLHQE